MMKSSVQEDSRYLVDSELVRSRVLGVECFAAKGSDGLAEAGLIAVAGMAREAQIR